MKLSIFITLFIISCNAMDPIEFSIKKLELPKGKITEQQIKHNFEQTSLLPELRPIVCDFLKCNSPKYRYYNTYHIPESAFVPGSNTIDYTPIINFDNENNLILSNYYPQSKIIKKLNIINGTYIKIKKPENYMVPNRLM